MSDVCVRCGASGRRSVRLGETVVVLDWRNGLPYTPSVVTSIHTSQRIRGCLQPYPHKGACGRCSERGEIALSTEAHSWLVSIGQWERDVLEVRRG